MTCLSPHFTNFGWMFMIAPITCWLLRVLYYNIRRRINQYLGYGVTINRKVNIKSDALVLSEELFTMSEKRTRQKKLVVSDEAVPFVARGGQIFSRQVIGADLGIEDGETVIVVDKKDHIITTAQALL